jgi:predicted ATPase
MSDLPTGTVTFLFTDVEGSTRLLQELGPDAYAAALLEHRRVLREACAHTGGVEVDTQGDAFFFAFPTAQSALGAARTAADALERGPIRVRSGVHTGTPVVTEEGYVGEDVHRAARIAAAGHGGQILVSAATAALLDGDPLVDLGEHRFKDLSAPERVYQLGDRSFPRLRSLYQTNLPTPATAFLGRERELAELVGLLRSDDHSLVTLTGPGGTGKTRLALQASAEASDAFVDGVWWVPLASVHDPGLVLASLADVLGVEEQPGLAKLLALRLSGTRSLVLFDNAEHLLPAIAHEIAVLRDVAGPTLLVTSRERLQLEGEHVYAVPTLLAEDGVELFLSRARSLSPALRRSSAVDELCSRLDHLPLALELAAARTVLFSPEQLLERMSERLDLLKAGRDADPRQQTLRATIEWSYDLLDDGERRLFRALSVFAGGCRYEAAEAVCDADPDTLQSLLDKSLVRRLDRPSGPRYVMLETIRELAAEGLSAAGETDVARRRHAEYFLHLARSANLANEDEGQPGYHLVLPERDNMREALSWALETREQELGLELVVALESFWATNSPQEGAEWAARLLAGEQRAPDRALARGLRVRGGMEMLFAGPEVAGSRWERALDLSVRAGDEKGAAILMARLAQVAMARGDFERARMLAEESVQTHRRIGFRKGEVVSSITFADIARADGDRERELAHLEESRLIAEEVDFRWWLAGMLARIAVVCMDLGRVDHARQSALRALELSQAMFDRKAVVYELGLLAEVDAAAGDTERAGKLWGAAEAESERTWMGSWLHGTVEPERVLRYADERFERGRAAGRVLSIEEAVALALRGDDRESSVGAT